MTGSTNPLGLRRDARGLSLDALGLWLDPVAPPPPGDLAFVSHAHAVPRRTPGRTAQPGAAEHAAVPLGSPEHPAWVASAETVALIYGACGVEIAATDRAPSSARPHAPPPLGGRPLAWGESASLPLRGEFGPGEASISLAPAGHVLGGAQLVVDHPRGRLVYTGDFSPNDLGAPSPGRTVPCDELVVTATFALPIFRFEPPARALAVLVEWCVAQRTRGASPIMLVQSPGPAQRVAQALGECDVPVVATEAIRRDCRTYEALGVRAGAVGAPGIAPPRDGGAAVLATPDTRPADLRRLGLSLSKAVVAYVSGWARLDAAVAQKRADVAFVMADLADYDGCLALVEESCARRVYTTHGYTRALAHGVARQGRDAIALEGAAIDDRASS